jgi:hypothetical protein
MPAANSEKPRQVAVQLKREAAVPKRDNDRLSAPLLILQQALQLATRRR